MTDLPTAIRADDALVSKYMADATVLVVDQNSSSRPLIRRLMSSLGAKTPNVDIAENYAEALHKVSTLKPSLVFADHLIGKNTAIEVV